MGQTLASELAAYIEGLTLTQGRFAGQPFHLARWQKTFIRGAFKPDVADAALTVGRGIGKTTFTAAIGCAAIDGPLILPRAESIVIASSFEQAMICFRTALAFLTAKYGDLRGKFRLQDSVNRASVTDRESGAMLRLIGSDPARAHGLAPALVVADELAQWPAGNIGRMLSALETSRGKLERTTMLWLGTRPATSAHPFEAMLEGGADYSQKHFAPMEDNPFSIRTWRKANPGLDNLPDLLKAIRGEAARAKKDADKLAQFRALRLNQGTSDVVERFVLNASTWEKIESADAAMIGKYALGVDLGASASMSALSGYWPDTGALRVLGMFPEHPSLEERGLSDGVGELYTRAAAIGELHTGGDEISDVVQLLRLALEYWGIPSKIVCDDWRAAELRQAIKAVGLSPTIPVELRRMGWKDGAQDLKSFRDSALDGKITPMRSLLMRSALAEARDGPRSCWQREVGQGWRWPTPECPR